MANNINLDSKHIPQTARAWRAPDVLNIIAGWTFLTIMTIMGVTWFVQFREANLAEWQGTCQYEADSYAYNTPGRLRQGVPQPEGCAPYNPTFVPYLKDR